VITAFGVAGIKSINPVEDSQVFIHPNQSISFSGEIVDKSSF